MILRSGLEIGIIRQAAGIFVHKDAELLQAPKNKGVKRLADPTPFKNPNHFKNHTRNIKVAGNIVTINIFFIIQLMES